VAGAAERAGQAAAEEQAGHGHAALEEAEDDGHPQPGPAVGPGRAETHAGAQVGQPERHRDEQQGRHSPNATRAAAAAGSGLVRAGTVMAAKPSAQPLNRSCAPPVLGVPEKDGFVIFMAHCDIARHDAKSSLKV
jgi:hypothetical protein